jgi:hypothetical protein
VPIDAIVQERGTLPQSYVGLLTDSTGAATILASSTRHGRTMSIKVLRPIEVPAGQGAPAVGAAARRRAVPARRRAARRQGQLRDARHVEKLLSNVPRLAVSIQDAPAKAGDAPAGFILTGHCVKLW